MYIYLQKVLSSQFILIPEGTTYLLSDSSLVRGVLSPRRTHHDRRQNDPTNHLHTHTPSFVPQDDRTSSYPHPTLQETRCRRQSRGRGTILICIPAKTTYQGHRELRRKPRCHSWKPDYARHTYIPIPSPKQNKKQKKNTQSNKDM